MGTDKVCLNHDLGRAGRGNTHGRSESRRPQCYCPNQILEMRSQCVICPCSGFYQDPHTYSPSGTTITPLGTQQEHQLGSLLRQIYLQPESPSFIDGINATLVDETQIHAIADAGGEGGVILDSAAALLQGLFPANPNVTITLANGTTITAPLGGYQYIPIESVEPENDISLEGWTQCNTFTQATKDFYSSSDFKAKSEEYADFFANLPQFLDGREVNLENMWNIFDFMLVQSIHNRTFSQALPETYLEQGRHLTNWHEWNIFSSSQLDSIRNVAGRTILPSIMEGLSGIADPSNPLKVVYFATAYKPFLSLFNMLGVADMNPQLQGFVNFAGAVAIEVRESSGGEPVLRFNFKNGTDDASFNRYDFLGTQGDAPLSTLINHVASVTINSTSDWCSVCQNNKDRGCDALAFAAAHNQSSTSRHQFPAVGAGFLGAGIALVVAAAMLGVLSFLGYLTFGKHRRRPVVDESSSVEKALN
ncbi:hypothetical protein AX16_006620 [Volvariella volvacea WC 439]|nr:hypothetical protein AX16_006620 [Volvariella volvacea WC 439]